MTSCSIWPFIKYQYSEYINLIKASCVHSNKIINILSLFQLLAFCMQYISFLSIYVKIFIHQHCSMLVQIQQIVVIISRQTYTFEHYNLEHTCTRYVKLTDSTTQQRLTMHKYEKRERAHWKRRKNDEKKLVSAGKQAQATSHGVRVQIWVYLRKLHETQYEPNKECEEITTAQKSTHNSWVHQI